LKKLEFFLNYSEVTENTLSQVTKEELKEWAKEFDAKLRENEKFFKKYISSLGLVYDPEEDYSFSLGLNASAIAKAASDWSKKGNSFNFTKI